MAYWEIGKFCQHLLKKNLPLQTYANTYHIPPNNEHKWTEVKINDTIILYLCKYLPNNEDEIYKAKKLAFEKKIIIQLLEYGKHDMNKQW